MKVYSIHFLHPRSTITIKGRSFGDVAKKAYDIALRPQIGFTVHHQTPSGVWINGYRMSSKGITPHYPRAVRARIKTGEQYSSTVVAVLTLRQGGNITELAITQVETTKYRRKSVISYDLFVPYDGAIRVGEVIEAGGLRLCELSGPDLSSSNFARFANIEFENHVDVPHNNISSDVNFIHENLHGRWSFYYDTKTSTSVFRFEDVQDAIRFKFQQ